MDILIASSRGNYITEKLIKTHPHPENLHIYSESSLKLSDAIVQVPSIMKEINPHRHPTCHVYLIAGLCDVTYRDFDPAYSKNTVYEEVIFNEDQNDAFNRVSSTITELSDKIVSHGGTPCFATIIPSNLEIWNNIRLNQHKTAFLLHHPQYKDMQESMISVINRLNRFIMDTNNSKNMYTPLLADTIITNRGYNVPPRYHWNRMADGVHPGVSLIAKWVKRTVEAMSINRLRHTPTSYNLLADDSFSEIDQYFLNC